MEQGDGAGGVLFANPVLCDPCATLLGYGPGGSARRNAVVEAVHAELARRYRRRLREAENRGKLDAIGRARPNRPPPPLHG